MARLHCLKLVCSSTVAAVLLMLALAGCGGSATAPITPPFVKNFSLTFTPSTGSITAGGAALPISLLATAVNGFTGTVTVTLSGLGTGVTASPASLSLTPGTAAAVSLTAAASATTGSQTITFTGASGTLSHTATLTLAVAAAATPPPPSAGPDITTYHYDNTRQGWNQLETILTTTNVTSATFGLKGNYPLDGKVDAAPLYLGAVAIGGTTHNIIYAVTEHASVYALDASTGASLWKVSTLGTGESTAGAFGCNQITPEIGITSTPVIDRSYGTHGAIFVVAMSKAGSAYHQRLHALDLTTGAELPGSPSEITATYPGSGENSSGGQVVFDPARYAERIGLLLLNGTIYLGWTSHCDQQPYTGWVMGYSEATLQQTSVLNLTPNGSEGSLWMAGYGMAADSAGSIYFLDANGTLDVGFDPSGFPTAGDFGNAMIKLGTTGGLMVTDFWEPYNTHMESDTDEDLGSGGAMLLPDLTDSSGTVRHLLVGAGKDKNIYLGDRDNLGKFHAADNSNLYQQVTHALPNGSFSGPAYFNGTVYYGGVGDVLRAFPITNAKLASAASSTSSSSYGYPGTTPSVSSNGTTQGIVWAVESGTSAAAVLHAYDATNLGNELYNSKQASNGRDSFGQGNKFITPVVANGQVLIGTPTGIAIFGLLTQ